MKLEKELEEEKRKVMAVVEAADRQAKLEKQAQQAAVIRTARWLD